MTTTNTKLTTKRNAKAPPGTQDILHENVAPAGNNKRRPPEQLKVLTVEEVISMELQKLSPIELRINNAVTAYDALQIAGVEDKEGYKKVKAAWGEVRTIRTDTEKLGLALRADQNLINKAIGKREAELVDLVTPLEKKLNKLWKDIDEQKEQAERDRVATEEAALKDRLDQLRAAGLVFDGAYYALDTISTDVATVRTLTQEQFTKFKGVVEARKAELDEKARVEQERQDELREQQRQQQQQLEEGQRLLRQQQQELQDQQDKLNREKQEAARQRKGMREAQLLATGLAPNRLGDQMVYSDGLHAELRVEIEEVLALDDGAFADAVTGYHNHIAALKQQHQAHLDAQAREREATKKKKALLGDRLTAAGLLFHHADESFRFSNPYYSVTTTADKLLTFDDAAVDAEVKTITSKVLDARKRQAKADDDARAELEKERLAELSDDQVFEEHLVKLLALAPPDTTAYKAKKSVTRQTNFRNRLGTLVEEFRPQKKVRP